MKHVEIVAEVGCNHMGDLRIAKELIWEAKRCGCDYVKFQKRDLNSLPAELADKPYTSLHSFGATYRAHREALEFDEYEWAELYDCAKAAGIGFFGTAFDLASAEFLSWLQLPYLKVGSMQCQDFKFLRDVCALPLCPPIILSTGMCDENGVVTACGTVRNLAVLVHATSSYPCPEDEVNLLWLNNFRIPARLGLSGHYAAGNGAIEAAAVALGVTYIERHFTLDRTWKGTDQAASLEPAGMVNVVKAIRSVEKALGDGVKRVMPSEEPIIKKLKCR